MDQYLAAISKKADEVRDTGINIKDEELVLFALDGLDSSYDTFVTVITATTRDISFSEFKGLLKARESTLSRNHLSRCLLQIMPKIRSTFQKSNSIYLMQ